jgi:hypothetical protein
MSAKMINIWNSPKKTTMISLAEKAGYKIEEDGEHLLLNIADSEYYVINDWGTGRFIREIHEGRKRMDKALEAESIDHAPRHHY